MAEDIAISVNDVSKMYKLYDNPMDRLKESLGLSRKKKYKELWHENPPKWLKLLKCRITRYKPKGNPYNLNFSFEIPKTEVEKLNQILLGIERKQAYKENTDNLVNTTRILSEWRKQNYEN